MKKNHILIAVTLFFSVLLAASVRADYSQKITIDDVTSKRVITITEPESGDSYLLHLQNGCGDLKKGQSVSLVVRGTLNGSGDIIKTDSLHQCNIDDAQHFNQKLYVKYVYSSNTEARVTDESGSEYAIQYGRDCARLSAHRRQFIYALQGSETLRKSDRLILPNKEGMCSINYLKEKEDSKPRLEPSASINKAPTAVRWLKAFPRNGAVFLSWRPARDDKRIDHYVIGYNAHQFRADDLSVSDMPYTAISKSTHYTVRGLDNNRAYYFYVTAVDNEGQISSDWSPMATAVPKSSIFSKEAPETGTYDFNLRIDQESSKSFLIRWDSHPSATRYSVYLEVDGERELSLTNYSKPFIRILKNDQRKGKTMELTVRAYSIRGYLEKGEFEFGF